LNQSQPYGLTLTACAMCLGAGCSSCAYTGIAIKDKLTGKIRTFTLKKNAVDSAKDDKESEETCKN
jgi:hypothetical protein